ncbi:MAG: glycosyltransferase family 2 protein [Chlamydiae bacterium]|nr:glycosyltransferase family 2 protein [Chlamydiota bacterium]
MNISVTILTKNSEETLSLTLDSLKSFEEVLVFDTGSVDQTLQIAKQYPNVRILENPFQGFGKMHNLAAKEASYDWILSIDSDEILTPALSQEILSLKLNPTSVYSLDRHNYFEGKWIRCCSGWYPDPVVRLYHRNSTQFTDDQVHETVVTQKLKIVPLKNPLIHTPYRSIDQFLCKMQLYSTLFARQNQGKTSSLSKALFHGFFAFMKNYFFKRGFLGGRRGFVISVYNAHTTYYKYLKLAFLNKSAF